MRLPEGNKMIKGLTYILIEREKAGREEFPSSTNQGEQAEKYDLCFQGQGNLLIQRVNTSLPYQQQISARRKGLQRFLHFFFCINPGARSEGTIALPLLDLILYLTVYERARFSRLMRDRKSTRLN